MVLRIWMSLSPLKMVVVDVTAVGVGRGAHSAAASGSTAAPPRDTERGRQAAHARHVPLGTPPPDGQSCYGIVIACADVFRAGVFAAALVVASGRAQRRRGRSKRRARCALTISPSPTLLSTA